MSGVRKLAFWVLLTVGIVAVAVGWPWLRPLVQKAEFWWHRSELKTVVQAVQRHPFSFVSDAAARNPALQSEFLELRVPSAGAWVRQKGIEIARPGWPVPAASRVVSLGLKNPPRIDRGGYLARALWVLRGCSFGCGRAAA